MKSKSKLLLLILTSLFILAAFCFAPAAMNQIMPEEAPEYSPGSFTTIVDEQENILSIMSRAVYAGDEIYTAEGRQYRLEKVRDNLAVAKFIGVDPQIAAFNEFYQQREIPAAKQNNGNKPDKPANFALYHTHTDESYMPSDGAASMRYKGGIYQVGAILAEGLKKAGMGVDYDQTPHCPHDNNAYVRSRRTAVKLLNGGPVAMFDVHRDGVPNPKFYRDQVSGMHVAQIRVVVGRENPRMAANLEFAKQMLTAVNNVHPKLVKEIFVGKGNYNQDLLPTALLLEAGTYTNTREEAERGVSLFAEALPAALGINGTAPAPEGAAAPEKSAGAARGAWKALAWLLGLTVCAGLAFLLLNDPKLAPVRKKLLDSGFFNLRLLDFKRLSNKVLSMLKEVMPLMPRRAARKPEINNTGNKHNGDHHQ